MILLWVLIGYLCGSFPSGYVFFKLRTGKDIRLFGSGNIGATNVGRFLGKKWAILVAITDMFKGGFAVLMAFLFGIDDPLVVSLIGFAGVCGHNFPVWLGFKGGKGVSTTYGVISFLQPPLSFLVAAAGGIVWFFVMKVTGYVSLASLISLFMIPLFFLIVKVPLPFVVVSLLLAVQSVYRHRGNIKRIFDGTELKVGGKSKSK